MNDRRRFAMTPDDITKAAGILPIAADTGRILLNKRSLHMVEGGKFAAWGGFAALGESPIQNAVREFHEESLYHGSIILIPAYTQNYPTKNLIYETFVGVIPHEFKPSIDKESMDYQWTTMSELYGGKIDFHPECLIVINEIHSLLQTIIEKSGVLNEESLYDLICHKMNVDVNGLVTRV